MMRLRKIYIHIYIDYYIDSLLFTAEVTNKRIKTLETSQTSQKTTGKWPLSR